jgi:ABC-type xylose transport system permease subunit
MGVLIDFTIIPSVGLKYDKHCFFFSNDNIDELHVSFHSPPNMSICELIFIVSDTIDLSKTTILSFTDAIDVFLDGIFYIG